MLFRSAPGHGAPGPGYGQPGYTQPPGYGQAAYGQNGYAQPGYAQPGYGAPAMGYLPGDVDVVGQRIGQYLLDSLLAIVPFVVLLIVGTTLASLGSTALAVVGLLITLVAYIVALGGSFVVLAWWPSDRKSTRLNSSHSGESRMPSSA